MKTLYDKLWDDHVVEDLGSGDHLVYIDRHFLHEVTSPQAFDGISKKNLKPWRLAANIATPDHNVPTARGQNFELESIEDEVSKIQIIELDRNCKKFLLNNLTNSYNSKISSFVFSNCVFLFFFNKFNF